MHRNQEAVADKTHQYAESAACKTHQQPAPVARDTQIYKKVLGSRRYLATVFWSLSTATSDTQRERAFVKTAYPSQHTHPTKRFASNVTHPTKKFCLQRPPTKYFKKEPTIMEKWQRSLYQPNLPLGADGTKVTASKAHITLSKEAAK